MRTLLLSAALVAPLGCNTTVVLPDDHGQAANGGDANACGGNRRLPGACGARSVGSVHVAWERRFGVGTGYQDVGPPSIDATGATTITGTFLGKIDFGSGALGNDAAESSYIARFDAAGQLQWAKAFEVDSSSGLAAYGAGDAAGNTLLVGQVSGSGSIGGHTVSGQEASFAAQLDAKGDVTWSKSFGDYTPFSTGGAFFDSAGRPFLLAVSEAFVDFGAGPALGGANHVQLVRFTGQESTNGARRSGEAARPSPQTAEVASC